MVQTYRADTLETFESLQAAGFDTDKARALLSLVPKHDMDEFATKSELYGVRDELKGDIANVRDELKGDIANLKAEIANSKADILKWLFGIIFAQTGIFITVMVFLLG